LLLILLDVMKFHCVVLVDLRLIDKRRWRW